MACEPDGHEGLLTLVALGCGTGVVPRLVLDNSAVRERLAVVPADPAPEPFPIGLWSGGPICGGRWWRRCGVWPARVRAPSGLGERPRVAQRLGLDHRADQTDSTLQPCSGRLAAGLAAAARIIRPLVAELLAGEGRRRSPRTVRPRSRCR
ncbi:hypothetical protein SVIOM74S_00838 [Streptomyces violarus]